MRKLGKHFCIVLSVLSFVLPSYAQNGLIFNHYHTNAEVQKVLKDLEQKAPSKVAIHKIAVSPGGEPISILEIGKELKNVPAIFVGANFEGKTPVSTEGALYLAKMLLDSTQYSSKTKWYLLVLPNPDATAGYFSSVKWERTVNNSEVNDDADDKVNEDGYDDLNADGLITQMRVEDPEGSYVISEKDSRIMVPADAKKGERGKYKIYSEGIDNDGDGQYNEDGIGGINVGINFPHLFKTNLKDSGLWPGESPEAYGIMGFVYDHPEISMVFTLGTSDFCSAPPRGGRKGGANMESIKIPVRFASRLGADPEKNYTMTEVIEMFKTSMPGRGGREMTADVIMDMLGLGAAVNPMEDDLKFYTDYSTKYKEYLKAKGFSTDRLSADPDKDGSFELWAYYHLGVPSFSMNLFTIPKQTDAKSTDAKSGDAKSTEGKPGESRAADTKSTESKASEPKSESTRSTETRTFGGRKTEDGDKTSGDDRDKTILAYIDKNLKGNGFVKWQPFTHPSLGKVEIGGYAPFVTSTPPASQIDSLCKVQLPWLLQLSKKLPDIRILKEEITSLGAGVYRLELFVENKGALSYPIAMGARNRQPAPVIVILKGENIEFLEGISRMPLGDIGNNQVKKLVWVIRSVKKSLLTATLESPVFSTEVKQIKIGE